MKGYILYPTYETIEDQTIVQLHGRLENGQSFVTINKVKPYFYIKETELKKVERLLSKYVVEKTPLKTFHEEKVLKILAKNQSELNKLVQEVHKKIDTYEADIKPHMRFIIDKNILGTIKIEGEYTSSDKIDRIYNEPDISKTDPYKPNLKIVSIDTESDKDSSTLYCIGLYTEKEKKVFMITKNKLKNVVSCKNEVDCLLKFKAELIKIDPDVITGWNFIDFDLVYLKSLYAKNKIPFDIGRDNDNVRLRIESGFFKNSSADITGRQVIDAMSLVKDPFIQEAPTIRNAEFESYGLEDVSQAILKEGKLLKGKSRHTEIRELFEKNTVESHQKLADYNLKDTELVYKILEKTKMIELAIERSLLTGLSLDRITASIAAFDSLYLRKAKARGLVSPTTRFSNKEERIKGGYVHSSKPGVYHNVLILDFKSLYPSIIKTFNIDPASFVEKPQNKKELIESPNKAHFKNTNGILPEIISTLHEAREKAKSEKRELSSYAIKIIQNSFFGVLANPNCRFFNLDIANAITHFGQFILKLTAQEIEKLGYKVIYEDTDSTFIETNLEKEKALILGQKIQSHINAFYNDYIKKNYNRQSFLELEYKKLYLAMLLPKLRGKEEAAKKRYAGLLEKNGKEELEITGLEAIRGDWTEAAQLFQKELLLKLFKKEPLEPFIKDYIKKIREGKLDSKLVYRKSIRKSLDEYTKTTPPHVKAARKLIKLDSNVIEYYVTIDGPEPIQNLKHKIDYEHYIEKQIAPIANQILNLINKKFEDLTESSKQAKLF
ncbi:MAG: DNA polymerase II [Nanoarchaeota archaeon]|nr:DNA polymerase II [Nanoarchaeota archaeon]